MGSPRPRRRSARAAPDPRALQRARGSPTAGFTLVELLLVLVILSVLAGIVVPRFANRSEKARRSAAVADLQANLATALDLYELDNGRFPTTEQGLLALVKEPTAEPRPRNWNGPYVRGGLPRDPWSNPYQYRHPAEHEGSDYDLFSLGPDGAAGGTDDITSWGLAAGEQ